MPTNPNKLSRFWQELKRRNVVRVITVYAGAAFVILELTDIITEPLKLPSWLLPVVIVLLSIGFIIASILSWIYDIQPEGGIVKTETAKKVSEEDKAASSNSWKIASYISFIVIVGLIVLNIIPRSENREILDKSIAVIPFVSLSDDPEKQYQADGIMDALLLHLSKIEDLRVISRTSVEQYRDTKKVSSEICREMSVGYLLEGSFQKSGDQIRLIVQLIQSGKEGHVWANNYDREWKDIFSVQSEVAQLIAKELQAVITTEEKQLIEKIPTSSLTAWDFYQRARAEHERFLSDLKNKGELERAEDLYHKALEYDSTFALAYTGLALAHWNEHLLDSYSDENYLDTLQILADKALAFDRQLSEAYVVKGLYYLMNSISDQAINEIDKAIKFNPNNWMAYYVKGHIYSFEDDHRNSIENFYHATSLYRGPILPVIYGVLASSFSNSGFKQIGEKYANEALALDDDSASYYSSLASSESNNGNYIKGIEFYKRSIAIDSTADGNYMLIGNNFLFLDQFEKALEHYKKGYDLRQAQCFPEQMSAGLVLRIGQCYLNFGKDETAAYYLNRSRELYNELNDLGRIVLFSKLIDIYELSCLYAILGEKSKALERLRLLYQKQHIPVWLVFQLKADPSFNSIRDEPEFQQIVRDVEAKYQASHGRIRQWLDENDML